jgi:hypothetical protein
LLKLKSMSELSQLKELLESFTQLTRCIHSYERAINELPVFSDKAGLFKSSVIVLAANEIRFARMFSGDCVRLLVNGSQARIAKFDAESLRWTQPITQIAVERDAILRLKVKLRESIYKALGMFDVAIVASTGCEVDEFLLYHGQLLAHLKRCDQCLGLRLG